MKQKDKKQIIYEIRFISCMILVHCYLIGAWILSSINPKNWFGVIICFIFTIIFLVLMCTIGAFKIE